MAASPLDQYLAPGALWKFLGERKGEPFRPFPAQAEALSLIRTPWPGMKPDGGPYPTIFGVCCGRRFGKTTLAEKILWQGLIAPDDAFGPPTVRLTADTEEHGHKVWDRFTYHLMNTDLKALLREWNKDRNLVTLLNGATAQLISANNPAALSGDAVTLWVVDESQELTYEAWNNLYPSTADRDGVIVLVGVAENDGPFREICWKGASEDHPDYMRLSYPTAANPFVPRRRIELAASEMDPSRFK